MENRELTNKPCSYGKLIYDKEQKNMQWGMTLLSSLNSAIKSLDSNLKSLLRGGELF